MKYRVVLFLVVFFISFAGCRKDKEQQVPYYYVNFKISLSWPQYSMLKVPGNYAVITNDIIGDNQTPHGIILYRLNEYEFYAYDRTCTYKVQENCAVSIDPDNIFTRCGCCNSRFFLMNGDPTDEGPATVPLKQYRVSVSGQDITVSN